MEIKGRTSKTIFGGSAPKGAEGSSWHNADGILDNWSKREWSDGLQIESLEDLDCLCVQTENSTYEITVLSRHTGEVMVRGGHFSPNGLPFTWPEAPWVAPFSSSVESISASTSSSIRWPADRDKPCQ